MPETNQGFTKKTLYLPPEMGVWLAWSITDVFREEKKAGTEVGKKINEFTVDSAKNTLTELGTLVDKQEDELQKTYYRQAKARIHACVRSLRTIYNGRELNDKQIAELRKTYLKFIREKETLTRKFLDNLLAPASAATVSGGGIYLLIKDANDTLLNIFSVASGIVIFIATYWLMNRRYTRLMKEYIRYDYEQTQFYEQYLRRVADSLNILYKDLMRIHREVFGSEYPSEKDSANPGDKLYVELKTRSCERIHEHVEDEDITRELWVLCETIDEKTITGKNLTDFRRELEEKDLLGKKKACEYRRKKGLRPNTKSK